MSLILLGNTLHCTSARLRPASEPVSATQTFTSLSVWSGHTKQGRVCVSVRVQ